MEANEIICPYCAEPQQSLMESPVRQLTSGGYYKCFKCKNVFEWFEKRDISYLTYRVVQVDKDI
jgi:DNA-directed RNA polymerase subunit RPC12/RpoP